MTPGKPRLSEDGDDPQPVEVAGAADLDRAAGADDVAGTDLGRDGGGEGLEGAQAAFLCAAAHGEVAEDPPHPFSEAADLHEASADGEEQAGTHQQKDQDIIREIKVDGLRDVQQCVHGTAS